MEQENTTVMRPLETDAGGTKDYAYDHRGNLLSVTSGEEVLKAYGFDAANQMSSSMGRTARTIRYTLDLTRQ